MAVPAPDATPASGGTGLISLHSNRAYPQHRLTAKTPSPGAKTRS
jgi:hypothetical protein